MKYQGSSKANNGGRLWFWELLTVSPSGHKKSTECHAMGCQGACAFRASSWREGASRGMRWRRTEPAICRVTV